MTDPADWQNDLQALCEAVIENRLTPEQAQRLEELVLTRPEARRFYAEYLHQHACLHWSAAEPALLPGPATLPAPASRPRRRWLAAAGLLAASVLLGVGVWLNLRQTAPQPVPLPPAPVATLVGGKACRWDAGTLPTENGTQLSAGRLRLAEGVARIRFASGAEITLEAPADLELVSMQKCVLHSGRLIATVPSEAIGFLVDTPTAVLKDLGTEFGVHVRDANTADVQVFKGRVDVQHRASGRTESLLTGKNRRFAADAVADFDPFAEKPPAAPTVAGRMLQISTAMGRGKDAYVQPVVTPEHQSDVLLLVKNEPNQKSNYNRKAYLGLDLAPLAGRKVVDAQLSFTFAPTGMGFASEVPDATFAVYGVTDESLDDWNEKTLRWQNAPANGPGGAGVDPGKTVRLGTFQIGQGALEGTRSISGPALVDFLNRDTNGLATFILVRETLGSGRYCLVHGFAGKNHPTLPPPTLKLTVR